VSLAPLERHIAAAIADVQQALIAGRNCGEAA
jgi:hypothetical protein